MAVSIHVPARGTTKSSRLFVSLYLFQSTFPRGERRGSGEVSKEDIRVSIHVPARGTTGSYRIDSVDELVSIHVPARGTTQDALVQAHILQFQSTFPRGERRCI